MINNLLQSRMSMLGVTPPGTDPTTPILSDDQKLEWNNYLSWLDKKGMRGKPELDKNNMGNKLFNQYIKENPKTTLSVDLIPAIRSEYSKLRNSGIESILAGKISMEGKTGKDVDLNRFMSHIVANEKSANPNYVGQHLTQTPFPGADIAKSSAPNVKLKVYSTKDIPK